MGEGMAEPQSDVRNLCERRANMRVDATILTDVFQKTRRSGFAWLKNLSKGGGLLRWCTTVSDGTRIRLAIRPSGRPAFEVDAEVLENASNRYANSLATRVAFRDVPKTGQFVRTQSKGCCFLVHAINSQINLYPKTLSKI